MGAGSPRAEPIHWQPQVFRDITATQPQLQYWGASCIALGAGIIWGRAPRQDILNTLLQWEIDPRLRGEYPESGDDKPA